MAALKPRQGVAGMVVSFSDRAGFRRRLTADESGLFNPADAEDESALDRAGFTAHASKPKAEKAEPSKPSADEPEEKE